eukprot:gene9492-9655_t
MSCDVNGRCEFQDLINRYQVPKWPKLREISEDYLEHTAHWSLYDQEVQGMNVLGMFNRGRDRHIGFVHESDLELSKCIECGQCVSVCPVGALSENTVWREVLAMLQSKRKIMVVQTAPAVRVAIGEEKIDMASLPQEQYDNPMGTGSGAGVLFGNTGGVMEAAVRTVYEVVTGKELPNRLNLEAVRGLKGVKEADLSLRQAWEFLLWIYRRLQVMSCPGGCIGGGGQPKTKGPDVLQKRMSAVYSIDQQAELRKSHENPQIKEIYANFFEQPNSHKAHELLHTHYTDESSQTELGYSDTAKAASKLPPEIEAAKADGHMPGPPAGWKFQPLFNRAALLRTTAVASEEAGGTTGAMDGLSSWPPPGQIDASE